jgi:hypothetical protein
MSLKKFDETNFNFWKEQMQDYSFHRPSLLALFGGALVVELTSMVGLASEE